MKSRYRPASHKRPPSTDSAASAGSVGGGNSVRDEIPITISGIVVETPENIIQARSVDAMKLHSVLKSLMDSNGQSARGAAKACKIPLSTFNGYLKPNKKQVDPSHLLAIAKHYGVTVDYLFGNEESPKFDKLPTKRLFSKWVKLTIEDLADSDTAELLKGDKK